MDLKLSKKMYFVYCFYVPAQEWWSQQVCKLSKEELDMRVIRSLIGVSEIAAAALFVAAGASTSAAETQTYTATLEALNSDATKAKATGDATFTVDGDRLTIAVDVKGLPPNMMHLQHFHGFKDGKAAKCPDAAADKNKDGVIDLIETETYAGTTMVPFHDDPISMEIPSETYPKADADGAYKYKKTVSLKDLQAAFAKAFGDADLKLDHRVVFIHGVPADADLPESAASLGTIPAQVTLPVACGEINKAE